MVPHDRCWNYGDINELFNFGSIACVCVCVRSSGASKFTAKKVDVSNSIGSMRDSIMTMQYSNENMFGLSKCLFKSKKIIGERKSKYLTVPKYKMLLDLIALRLLTTFRESFSQRRLHSICFEKANNFRNKNRRETTTTNKTKPFQNAN